MNKLYNATGMALLAAAFLVSGAKADDITVTFSYSSEDARNFVKDVRVNNSKVEDFDGNQLTIASGDRLTISPNTSYKLDQMTVNGEPVSWAGTFEKHLFPEEDTNILITAHPYASYSLTVKADDPSHVNLYNSTSPYGTPMSFTESGQVIKISEKTPNICWDAASMCTIEEVKVNGQTHEGTSLKLTGDTEIEFVTSAKTLDNHAAIWFDDYSIVDPENYYSFTLYTNSWENVLSGRTLASGYNLFDFDRDSAPFIAHLNLPAEKVRVYLNDTKQTHANDMCSLDLNDGDVVKYFLAADPVECTVKFDVAEDVTPEVTADMLRKVENLVSDMTCFSGTRIAVSSASDAVLNVTVNEQPIEKNPDTGEYSFFVSDPDTRVAISSNTGSGVSLIGTESAPVEVYTLQGIRVNRNVSDLPAGVYIIGGKKTSVR